MQKIVAVLIVMMLLMALSITSALAEEYDVSSLPTDELIALLENVQVELTERISLVEDNRIGEGAYIVGRDIKPGTYDFLCLDAVIEHDKPYNTIELYTVAEDGFSKGEGLWRITSTEVKDHHVLALPEGTLVEFWNCSGIITEIQPSWAP